jgi:hypothetical protein
VGVMFGNCQPTLMRLFPEVAQFHLAVYNFTKETFALVRNNRNVT